MRKLVAAAAVMVAVVATSAGARQTDDWRTVAPENLLVIDTTKGRVLVEMAPVVAPAHVERLRTLAARGFYDGLTFHRVLPNFMAQTGDPLGTGEGGSDLANLAPEFSYRRGREIPFVAVTGSDSGLRTPTTVGIHGVLPVATQPDAQMFVTADFKVDATVWFCPGVAGMARATAPDSANSQFFLMTGVSSQLNGDYTAWGRVVDGLEVVESLKTGPAEADGAVTDSPDRMTRVRTADDIPAAERPSVQVLDVRSPAFQTLVEETRAARGSRFSICDIQLPARVTGGA